MSQKTIAKKTPAKPKTAGKKKVVKASPGNVLDIQLDPSHPAAKQPATQNEARDEARRKAAELAIIQRIDQLLEEGAQHWKVRIDLGANHLTGQDVQVWKLKLTDARTEATKLPGKLGASILHVLFELGSASGTLKERMDATLAAKGKVWALHRQS